MRARAANHYTLRHSYDFFKPIFKEKGKTGFPIFPFISIWWAIGDLNPGLPPCEDGINTLMIFSL